MAGCVMGLLDILGFDPTGVVAGLTGQSAVESSERGLESQLAANREASDFLGGLTGKVAPFIKRDSTNALRTLRSGRREAISPFGSAFKLGGQALTRFSQGATPGGFGRRIEAIQSSGALDPLIAAREEVIGQQLAATGLQRSGGGIRELAEIRPEALMQLEQQLSGRDLSLAGFGQDAARGISGIESQFAPQLANVQLQRGQSLAGIEEQNLRDIANLIAGKGVAQRQAAGEQAAAMTQGAQNVAGIGVGALAAIFSDERLKTNVEPVGHVKNLILYTWDWVEGAAELAHKYGSELMNHGFMAQQVKEQYPDFVIQKDGINMVLYQPLLEHLDGL